MGLHLVTALTMVLVSLGMLPTPAFADTSPSSETTYTVTFDVGGSDPIEAQTVPVGGTVAEPATPTRPGYAFDGWKTWTDTANGPVSTDWNFNTDTVTADVTLQVSWVRVYSVLFSTGGTPVPSQEVKEGDLITEPDEPTWAGHKFHGWQDGSLRFWNFETDTVQGDTWLQASWTQTYTVTFDAAGGDPVAPQTVDEGGTVTKPATPTRPGFVFFGWWTPSPVLDRTQPATRHWNFDTDTVHRDTYLFATWLRVYSVNFSTGGTQVEPQNVTEGDLIVEPETPTWPGHKFHGWQDGSLRFWSFETDTVQQDTWLQASWTLTYEVTFLDTDGSTASTQTVDEDTLAQQPITTPTKDGYVFDGWMDRMSGAAWNFDTDTVTHDLVLAPRFTTTGLVSGQSVAEPTVAPTRTGYTFRGWSLQAAQDSPLFDFSTPITADVTLYAHWSSLFPFPNTVTTTFDSQGGSTVAPLSGPWLSPIAKPADPAKDGYIFDGWYTAADGGTAWVFSDAVGSNQTLYAHWSPVVVVVDYTVTFQDGHGGTFTAVTTGAGDFIEAPTAPIRAGYTFKGWFTAPTGGEKFDFSTTAISADTMIYAQWVKNADPTVTHTVSFKSNGGSAVPAQTVTDGSPVAKPAAPTRAGFSFEGWFTPGAKRWNFAAPVTGQMTLVAHWRAVVKVTGGKSNGAGESPAWLTPKVPTRGAGENLPETGSSFPVGLPPLAALLVLLGAVLVRRSRREA
jgi:uncharacterized repeat protein (TIGR02543 family)